MPATLTRKPEIKSFELRLTKAPDESGQFEGYAAVFGNVDEYGDVIEPGAFAKTLKENPQVPILWQHNSTEPIGVSTSMVEDEHGLKVSGQLELEVQRAREARALMQRGALKGLSIGYEVVKDAFDRLAGQRIRRLKELKLWEWSPVTFPANELAGVSAVKAAAAAGARGVKAYYDVYWDDDYQQIGALLCMIDCGTQFLISEDDEGDDPADITAMQAVLAALSQLLASELAELGSDDESGEVVLEAMSARLTTILCKEGRVLSASNRKLVESAVEALQALLDNAEPAKATRRPGAAKSDAEPELASTLASLAASMRAPA